MLVVIARVMLILKRILAFILPQHRKVKTIMFPTLLRNSTSFTTAHSGRKNPEFLRSSNQRTVSTGCSVCGGDVFQSGNYPVFGRLGDVASEVGSDLRSLRSHLGTDGSSRLTIHW